MIFLNLLNFYANAMDVSTHELNASYGYYDVIEYLRGALISIEGNLEKYQNLNYKGYALTLGNGDIIYVDYYHNGIKKGKTLYSVYYQKLNIIITVLSSDSDLFQKLKSQYKKYRSQVKN